MYYATTAFLQQYDHPHGFERMCADILNCLGYASVVLQAPRGGSDGGRDLTFRATNGGKGLACVTLRKDIETKFKQDFHRRAPSEYDEYILFCTAYLTSKLKQEFEDYVANTLRAGFIPYDIEGLRSLLDTRCKGVRDAYAPEISLAETRPPSSERADREPPSDVLPRMSISNVLSLRERDGGGLGYEVLLKNESLEDVYVSATELVGVLIVDVGGRGPFIDRIVYELDLGSSLEMSTTPLGVSTVTGTVYDSSDRDWGIECRGEVKYEFNTIERRQMWEYSFTLPTIFRVLSKDRVFLRMIFKRGTARVAARESQGVLHGYRRGMVIRNEHRVIVKTEQGETLTAAVDDGFFKSVVDWTE